MIKTVLSSLISKGLTVEAEIRQKIQSEVTDKLQTDLRDKIESAKNNLRTQLEDRGIKRSLPDLLMLIEEISPPASNAALSYALDALKPFDAGLGLRIARLTDQQIEMVIPRKSRNLNEDQIIHEAVIMGAAIEAVKSLWDRHCPTEIKMKIRFNKIEIKLNELTPSEFRVRYEVPESIRERALADLRSGGPVRVEGSLLAFDENEKCVAEVSLQFEIQGITLVA